MKSRKLLNPMSKLTLATAAFMMSLSAFAEGDLSNKGIGPVKELKLSAIDSKMAASGKKNFEMKCSACHKLAERYVGPAISGVTTRRSPEWIMNMILNPNEMLDNDPIAQELLGEYLTKMTFQNVSQDEARAILEYFRENDAAKAKK